jgi:energy-coupling factor transporter ATP-binding protein EcfA2
VCFQNPNDQFFETDVRKEILAGPKRLGKIDWKWFEQICDTLSLRLLLDRSPYRLSEGEKRRVALASILVMRPDVLVLDEPTAGQDGRFKETLAHMCASISEMGTAVVVVTHDLDFARTTADRWIVMHAGRIAADGAPEEMREKLLSILDATTDRPPRSVAGCA